LLLAAYEDAQIDPTTVTYIEAHGTATSLGDPIEIDALKNAFSALYKKQGQSFPEAPICGIGAVKSNIGHLETAAGIAGVLKVLLCLKNKQLPANLNFKTINPYIQLENSPFYIVDKHQEWKPLIDNNDRPIPRRSGVSSFGFGGSNAHVVLEEYIDDRPDIENNDPKIIVLSAKNRERLYDYSTMLLDYCYANPQDISLIDMAYTLQVGRESMDERLAMVVSNIDDLIEKLSQFKQKTKNQAGIYTGNPKQLKDRKDILIGGEAGKSFINTIFETKDLDRIAQLWTLGFEIDWQLLYDMPPKRISLPTYPFEKKRYWISSIVNQPIKKNVPIKQKQVHVQKKKIRNNDIAVETRKYLTQIFSEFLKIDPSDLSDNETFDMYGMDSVFIAQIAEHLNTVFENISPALLYKHKTISELADYFVDNHHDKLLSLFKIDSAYEEQIEEQEVFEQPIFIESI